MKIMNTICVLLLGLIVLAACGEQPPEADVDTEAADEATDPITGIDQTDPDDGALDLVTGANDATDAVGSISYGFNLYGTGVLESEMPVLEGEVRILIAEDGTTSMLAEMEYPVTDSLGEVVSSASVTASTDGVSAWLILEETREFQYGLMSDGADDLLDLVMGAVMYEYMIPEPFNDEITAGHLTYEGSAIIDGEECEIVKVVYQGGSIARWYFGRTDMLPRRVDRLIPDETGAQVLELSNMIVDDEIDPSSFELTAPEGYSEERYMSFLPPGSVAPAWELSTPDGGTLSLEDLRGNIVVMDFWATWCGPCRMVMPALQAIHEEYGESGVVVVGINTWEDADPVTFMEEEGYTYPITLGGDAVSEEYLVTGIPTFYVIGPEGTILFSARGSDLANEAALRAVIEENLP